MILIIVLVGAIVYMLSQRFGSVCSLIRPERFTISEPTNAYIFGDGWTDQMSEEQKEKKKELEEKYNIEIVAVLSDSTNRIRDTLNHTPITGWRHHRAPIKLNRRQGGLNITFTYLAYAHAPLKVTRINKTYKGALVGDYWAPKSNDDTEYELDHDGTLTTKLKDDLVLCNTWYGPEYDNTKFTCVTRFLKEDIPFVIGTGEESSCYVNGVKHHSNKDLQRSSDVAQVWIPTTGTRPHLSIFRPEFYEEDLPIENTNSIYSCGNNKNPLNLEAIETVNPSDSMRSASAVYRHGYAWPTTP